MHMCVSIKLHIIVVFLIQHCQVYIMKPKALFLQKVVTLKMICMYITTYNVYRCVELVLPHHE